MAQIVRIDGRVDWQITRDPKSNEYIAACQALKITAQADTWVELCETIAEIQDELFKTLLKEGALPQFLTKHGWQAVLPMFPIQATNIRFDIPVNMSSVANDRTREVHQ